MDSVSAWNRVHHCHPIAKRAHICSLAKREQSGRNHSRYENPIFEFSARDDVDDADDDDGLGSMHFLGLCKRLFVFSAEFCSVAFSH